MSQSTENMDSEDKVLESLKPGQIENLPPLQDLVGRNWITLRQLTNLLGVSYQTALRYVSDHKIGAVKIGGGWRIYEEELRRFLADGNLTRT